jgi:hypothetical protein
VNWPAPANGIGSVQGFLALIFRGSTRSIERASHLCANPSCILCGGPQLGLKVFNLNAEGLLKIPGLQKLLAEVSVGCNLPLKVSLEGAYLLLIALAPGRPRIVFSTISM